MNNMYDMIIIGGGPAGLSAAIYMARAKYKTLVIEKEKWGGQITITSEIVNYPGVFHTSGTELTKDMQKQAQAFGVEFLLSEVVDVELSDDIKTIKTTNGEFKTLGVILALGASPRQIGFEGENEFKGRGVAYCATCDGEFFTNMPVYVIGGGFAAVEEGIFLTKYASSVRMIVREEDFTCAKTVSDEIALHDKIKVDFNTEVLSISGENVLNKIKLRNNLTGEITENVHENGFGAFVFAGYVPNTKWLKDKIELDHGYIVTDRNQKTNINGVYAAGDVCIKELRQVVTAVSDGAIAATASEKYVASMHTKLNIPAFDVKGKTPHSTNSKAETKAESNEEAFINEEMKAQLSSVFENFTNTVTIKGVLDNSNLANEISSMLDEIQGISEKVLCKKEKATTDERSPYIEILNNEEKSSGIRFYAMPGGHEFNSFILSLYNVAGPGKKIADEDEIRINNINKPTDIKVLISLSCTMCPEVVMATGKIASLNENVTSSAMDIAHCQDLKEKYNVMSVPCMIINNKSVHFGKKNISQILDIIENN